MVSLWATATPLRAQDSTTADPTPSRPELRPAVRPAIVIDAERNFYDLRSGVTRFEDNVSITRGAMEVQADRGTIRQASGQITEVELEGRPSTWRDRLDDGSIVTGEASMIHFDVIANIVTLTGNAIIRHEQGEFTGDELVYDLTAESLAGRSTGNERVRVVIEPDAMSDPRPTPPPNGTGAADAGTGTDEPTSSDPDAAAAPGTEPNDPEPADAGPNGAQAAVEASSTPDSSATGTGTETATADPATGDAEEDAAATDEGEGEGEDEDVDEDDQNPDSDGR